MVRTKLFGSLTFNKSLVLYIEINKVFMFDAFAMKLY